MAGFEVITYGRFWVIAEARSADPVQSPWEWVATAHTRWASMYRRLRTNQEKVGVGITIAHNPLHGSGRADFPHPALTSGNDAHTAQRKRMIYPRRRQPAVNQALHSFPS